MKDIALTTDLGQHGNPSEAFEALETAEMETLERTGSKSDSAEMKCDRNPDEIPLVIVEFLSIFRVCGRKVLYFAINDSILSRFSYDCFLPSTI